MKTILGFGGLSLLVWGTIACSSGDEGGSTGTGDANGSATTDTQTAGNGTTTSTDGSTTGDPTTTTNGVATTGAGGATTTTAGSTATAGSTVTAVGSGGAMAMTGGAAGVAAAGAANVGTGGSVVMGAGGAGLGGAATLGSAGAMQVATGGAGDVGGGGTAQMGAGGATAAGELFTISAQLASAVDNSAPGTIGIVTWSTDVAGVTEAHLEFGLDTSYGMTAPVDLTEADYRTLLLGMKPSQQYHFRVVANDGTTSYASDDQTIDTGPATDLVSLGDFSVVDDAAREPGFIVISYWQGTGNSVAFIVDADGEIVWWYDTGIPGVARARMSADGKNMWFISASNQGSPLQRVSIDTLAGETYSATSGSHDITAVSGELMAYLDYSESDCDSIFEIDPSGATTEVFESNDYVAGNGCHGNALRYSQAEDVYTFSDVSQDIFVVNRSAQPELAWKLTERVPGGISTWGGRQHGHQLMEDSILIFANSGGQGDASAAIEYSLDGEEVFRYESGDSSANLGDVQRLPGGNTLVTFSNDSIVHEVDPAGNIVLEFDGGGSRIGYTLWRPTLYGAPPDISQ